jgi:cathepsin B
MSHTVSPPPGVVPCDSLPMYATPKCSQTCTDRTYASRYNNDKRLARTSYSVTGEKNMQKELMEKGTMTVAFTVFEDFELYKEGVYQHVKGKDKCLCVYL